MNTDIAKGIACSLIQEHGLHLTGWRFAYDNSKRRFGLCNYSTKTISLSKRLVLLNDEARVRNTILHEIAHALVGNKHGHDRVWGMKAREIGCDGNRCYTMENTVRVRGNYEAVCPNPKCGVVHYRFKKLKEGRRYSCGKCNTTGKFNPALILEYKKVA